MAKTNHFGPLAAAAGALVAVALLVQMMLVWINPQTAGAALPGANGRIAYSAWDGNDDEIFTIPATGGTPFQVTHNTVADTQPSYSPDGNTIAFARGNISTPAFEIDRTSATGGQVFKVNTNPLADERGPSWTVGRNQIAFYGQDAQAGQTDWEIYTMDLNTGQRVQVTHNNTTHDLEPSWQPIP